MLNADQTVKDSYSYDGYGVLLQDENNFSPTGDDVPPGITRQQDTSLLYAGEYFDPAPQMYNNRARWYNPYNGRFNRMDDYAGNSQDPQSLHKYLYCHANPVNAIDSNTIDTC